MEVTINTVTDVDREMECSLTREELQPHFDEAYRKALPTIELKGFRKGKVPLSMVKKLYGSTIELQAIEEITNDTFKKAMEERKIEPIGNPSIVDIKYKPGEPLSFKIKYEVKPEFEVKDFRGISVEKFVHTTTDAEVDREVRRLRQISAAFEEVPSVQNDETVVTVDIQEFNEAGAEIPQNKRLGMRIFLNEPTTEKEVYDALRKAEVGGIYEATFEHQHGDHTHTVRLRMTAKKIEKMILPEVVDAFAKQVSKEKFATVLELRQNIRKDLDAFWAERSGKLLENTLLQEIVKQYEFAVPESIVAGILDTFVDDVKNQQPKKQLPKNFDVKKYRETYRGTALWQAKWLLIKEALMKKEHIEITDADLEKLAETQSAQMNIDKDRLINFYKTSDRFTEQIRFDKLMELIKASASVKEMVTDDLAKFASVA